MLDWQEAPFSAQVPQKPRTQGSLAQQVCILPSQRPPLGVQGAVCEKEEELRRNKKAKSKKKRIKSPFETRQGLKASCVNFKGFLSHFQPRINIMFTLVIESRILI